MMKPLILLTISLMPIAASAMELLDDIALQDINGAGIGIVLENYELTVDDGSTWRVNTGGTAAELVFSEFWWKPNDGSATIGRTDDPVYFDVNNRSDILANGSNGSRTYIHLAAPQATLTTDLMDASYLMTLDHVSTAIGGSCTTATTCRYDTTRVTTRKMDIDGSYFRVWPEPLQRNLLEDHQVSGTTIGLAYTGNLNISAESVHFRINESPSKPSVTYNTNASPGSYTPNTTGSGSGSPIGDIFLGPCTSNCTAGAIQGLEYVYEVGQDFYQPVTIYSKSDGNLVLELMGIPNNPTIYNDFYSQPKGHVRIGSIVTDWDGTGPKPVNRWNDATSKHCLVCSEIDHVYTQNGPRRDFGFSRIEGIGLQYLKIETIGL